MEGQQAFNKAAIWEWIGLIYSASALAETAAVTQKHENESFCSSTAQVWATI